MRRAAILSVAAVAAVLLTAEAFATPGHVDRTATRVPLVVYGYPYAARCPGAGIADVVDHWGMYACNCTSYVAWALVANGQRIDWFVAGAMNAWNWPNVARRAHLLVDRHAARGSVVVWPSAARPYGHVAYVTAVNGDNSIDVAEYNLPEFGSIDTYAFDTRTSVSPEGAVFIHVPPRR